MRYSLYRCVLLHEDAGPRGRLHAWLLLSQALRVSNADSNHQQQWPALARRLVGRYTSINESINLRFSNVDRFPSGWLILGVALVILGSIIGLFPRTMPRTVQRRREALQKGASAEGEKPVEVMEEKASFKGNSINWTLEVLSFSGVINFDRYEEDHRPFGIK